jgi:hypothetical protein
LRNLHNVCTNLHSHKQCVRIPVSLHPYHHLLLLPLILAIPTGMRWNLSVLICFSFISREVEYFLCIYWPFVPFPLRIHVPIFSLGWWSFGFLNSL